MQATKGLCSHAKAFLEASARGKWGAITVSWGARRSRQRASRKDYRASHDNDEDGEGILRGSALTFFTPPHSWTTRLPCEETRAKSAGAPEPGWVTENRTDTHEAPTVNTIFRWVAGRPRETPEPATHASGPTPRNLLSPRRDQGTPPESLGGARKAWRHAPASARLVRTSSSHTPNSPHARVDEQPQSGASVAFITPNGHIRKWSLREKLDRPGGETL